MKETFPSPAAWISLACEDKACSRFSGVWRTQHVQEWAMLVTFFFSSPSALGSSSPAENKYQFYWPSVVKREHTCGAEGTLKGLLWDNQKKAELVLWTSSSLLKRFVLSLHSSSSPKDGISQKRRTHPEDILRFLSTWIRPHASTKTLRTAFSTQNPRWIKTVCENNYCSHQKTHD